MFSFTTPKDDNEIARTVFRDWELKPKIDAEIFKLPMDDRGLRIEMSQDERITKQVFEMIAECFHVPLADISRDYKIGSGAEKVADINLPDLDKTPVILGLVEFTMWLEEEIPPNIVRTPQQTRQDRLFHKRLAFGLVTAGQLIDWMAGYLSGDTSGN